MPGYERRATGRSAGRRRFCRLSAGAVLCGGLQAEQRAFEPLNRFPRMVHEWFVERLRKAERRRLARFDAIASQAEAEAHVRSVRERIAACFGPFPEKTPLRARVTGGFERDDYRVENVVFESRPDFLVSANLYLPKGLDRPAPGVVGTCGHSANGKAAETYQSFAQGLARQGYAVLLYDPIGQGERLQYVDAQWKGLIGTGTREHLHAGNQQFLVSEFFGSWRAWDGIRALDYLLSRDEVDPRRVGVTGNSGGGTMTTWLCALEQRWSMAAPSCFVTTFRRNLENELPADTEQCPPRAVALGLDHEDFLAAMAPKPVMILAKERDYFDVRGTEQAYARLKRLWRLLGAEENLALFVGPTYHGFSRENREAMYGWFNRAAGLSADSREPKLTIEADETLFCAPHGQVAAMGSKPVFAFTAEKAAALSAARPALSGGELRAAVRRKLRLGRRNGAPYARILRPRDNRGYPKPHAACYAVETEPGIQALVYRLADDRLLSRPPRGKRRAVLYLAHHSADREMREEPLVGELLAAEPDAAFFACDARGIGESRPDTTRADSFLTPYGSDYFYAVHSLMLDLPYVGRKTHDALAVIAWLERYGHDEIHLAAAGWGTLPAMFAAVLSPDAVRKVTLKGAPDSYRQIAETKLYDQPLSSFAPGVLEAFDLPDIRRELGAKLREA